MAIRTEKLLVRAVLLLIAVASMCAADPRIDNVLVKMVPPASTSLVGAHMDAIRATDLYRKMVDERKLPELDRFAIETGFDPRRDVRELLYITTPGEKNVLVARGSFHFDARMAGDLKLVRRGRYKIYVNPERGGGFCILDATLAAAGDLAGIEAVLDEWISGAHTGARPLLAHVTAVAPSAQVWGISTGFAGFIAQYLPHAQSAIDFSRIFRGLEDTWFEADLSTGLKATAHGQARTDQDAVNLRDAAKGLIGFGRLSVPQNEPELLRLWDGITVDQAGRAITIRADIAENLIDKLVEMFSSQAPGRY